MKLMIRYWLMILVVSLSFMSALAQETVATSSDADAVALSLADSDGQFANLEGVRVYYLDRGPTDGQAVILLHGFLGSVVDWTNTIPSLLNAGYRVVAFDRPPFGLSDKRTNLDYSTKAMSELTADLMDSLNISQAVIIGHSAGGQVAADFAVRFPEKVVKLVLVAGAVGITGPEFEGDADQRNPTAGAFELLANLDPDNPLAQSLVASFFNSDFASSLGSAAYEDPTKNDPSLMNLRMRALQIPGWEGGLLAFTLDSLSEANIFDLESLRVVAVPVALIWGESDGIVPLEVGVRLKELFQHVTWLTYPGVGHMPMDEITDQFNVDLIGFLAS